MHLNLFVKVCLPVLDGPARILREVSAFTHLFSNLPPAIFSLPARDLGTLIILLSVLAFACRLHKCTTGGCLVLLTYRYGLKL